MVLNDRTDLTEENPAWPHVELFTHDRNTQEDKAGE